MEIVAGHSLILDFRHAPVQSPTTRLASGRGAQRRAGGGDAGWDPPVGDLAAQVFRTELFQRGGLAIWNGSWYAGHYTLTYSVLFPPLAALLGPQVVGMLAVVSSSYLFDRLVRDRWGEAARWATLWFGAGVVTLLADGQLTFALGVAFGLAAMRFLQFRRPALALGAAAACALSSPVAGAFLGGVLLAGSLQRGGGPTWTAIWTACLPSASSPSSTSPFRNPASSPSPSPPMWRCPSGAAAR